MKTVKIVMSDGEIVIIENCKEFTWKAERKIVVVTKSNGNNLLFNAEFVKYAGFLDDLKEGESDE